jgi:hypothetical protein
MKNFIPLLIAMMIYIHMYIISAIDIDYFFYLAVFSGFSALYVNRHNLLFFLRTLILFIVGITPLLAGTYEGYYSRRSLVAQYDDISILIGLAMILSLFSSQVGFYLSNIYSYKSSNIAIIPSRYTMTPLYTLIISGIVIGIMIAYIRGGNIFEVAYASDGQKQAFPINATQVLANASFVLLVYYYYKYRSIKVDIKTVKYITLSVFLFIVFYAQFFKGARLDPLNMMLSAFILYRIHNNKSLRVGFRQLTMLALLFILMELFGYLRFALLDGFDLEGLYIAMNLSDVFIDKTPIISISSTYGNLAAGFSGTIEAIRVGDLKYALGGSYLDYFGRTFPAFVYPDRPESLAHLLPSLYGNSAGGGGYTEMAEIYLNFGLVGFLFIPGIISYTIGFSYNYYIRNYKTFRLTPQILLFFSLISVYIRGLSYQTFSFYRGITAVLFIVFIIGFFTYILDSKKCIKLE